MMENMSLLQLLRTKSDKVLKTATALKIAPYNDFEGLERIMTEFAQKLEYELSGSAEVIMDGNTIFVFSHSYDSAGNLAEVVWKYVNQYRMSMIARVKGLYETEDLSQILYATE